MALSASSKATCKSSDRNTCVQFDVEAGELWGIVMNFDAQADAIGDRITQIYCKLLKIGNSFTLNEDNMDIVIGNLERNGSDSAQRALAMFDGYISNLNDTRSAYDDYQVHEKRYCGHTRFYYVENGHVHKSNRCGQLHKGGRLTRVSLVDSLSGLGYSEAVKKLGPIMCTTCCKDAPSEWKRNPEDIKAEDPTICKGYDTFDYVGPVRTGYVSSNGGKCMHCGEWVSVKSPNNSSMRKHKAKPGFVLTEADEIDGKFRYMKYWSDVVKRSFAHYRGNLVGEIDMSSTEYREFVRGYKTLDKINTEVFDEAKKKEFVEKNHSMAKYFYDKYRYIQDDTFPVKQV